MKRIESLHNNKNFYLKERSRGDNPHQKTPTGGYSKPVPTSFSATGCITYNSDKPGSPQGEGGVDGHENPMW